MQERKNLGLALAELLVVVAILGALAVLGREAFTEYAARSRTSEMFVSLCRIGTGALNYYHAEHVAVDGEPIIRQFPETAGPTPRADCCTNPGGRCIGGDPDWTSDTWQALNFSMEHGHYYRYEFYRTGEGDTAAFTVFAGGDLDCDGDTTRNAFVGNGDGFGWGPWRFDDSD